MKPWDKARASGKLAQALAQLHAIATLHRLEYPEAGFLLGTVKEILGLFLRSPFVDLHAAYAVVSLANLCRELNLEEPPQDWILRLEEMAERVREEPYNIWMCSALSRVYVATGDNQLADRWLQRAITQARQFMSEAGVPGGLAVSVVTGIITAWEALPVEDQKRQLSELRYLLRFVLDYEKRDRLLGRLAVSVWDDKELFRGMFEEITLGGLEVILEALEQLEKGTAPAELLPMVFHDILEKASRNGTGFFAGNALLASQIAVKQQTYQTGAMVAALTAIEGFMREIAPLPGEGVEPGS